MWQSKSLSENKTLILYMFLTDYIKLYMCTKYSEYNSDVTGLSVCTIGLFICRTFWTSISCFQTTKFLFTSPHGQVGKKKS